MYAVLQKSLDQPISREALEAGAMATETLAKPDCAMLARELFGIVAGNLSQDEALGMQTALRAHGVETQVVEESALPKLPPPKRAQAFAIAPEGLRVTEYTGTTRLFMKEIFVFAAAGHVLHLTTRAHETLELVQKPVDGRHFRTVVEMVKENRLEDVPEFRVELFFAREPYRQQWILDNETVLRANDVVYRFRDRARLNELQALLGRSLPTERVNLGIRKAIAGEELIYPSVRAFEEEIVWSFYRLLNAAG